MRLPDLEAWAIFATVAERRSFSGAAVALSLSKATVSKAVSRLEVALQTPLFHRTSRRLSLTESGARLAAHAHRIVAEGEAAEEAARNDAAEPSGLIRVAAPMSFGTKHVAPLVATFLTRHRQIAIDLHLSDARVDLIGDGFDLALRIAALPDSSLRARKLRAVTVMTVASPAYLAAHGEPHHPAALGDHCCLTYSLSQSPETWRFLGPGGEQASVRPTGALRVNNGEAMLPALCDGLGIGQLPDFICHEEVAAGRLVSVLRDWAVAPIALHLVTPPGRIRARRVELLIAFLTASLGPRHLADG
jgi:DNA-binding transcriptional LysR family regulator